MVNGKPVLSMLCIWQFNFGVATKTGALKNKLAFFVYKNEIATEKQNLYTYNNYNNVYSLSTYLATACITKNGQLWLP